MFNSTVRLRLALVLQATLLLACSGSAVSTGDVSTDHHTSDISDDVDAFSDVDSDTEPEECTYNTNPISFRFDHFNCDALAEIPLDEWTSDTTAGEVQSMAPGVVTIETSAGDIRLLHYAGLSLSDLEHNIDVGDQVIIDSILYNPGHCVFGMAIHKTCGFSGGHVIIFRDGDLHNPYYPRAEDSPFASMLQPYSVSLEESHCRNDDPIASECRIDDVLDMLVTTESGDSFRLRQGESSIIPYSQPLECTLKYTNIYSYYSSECGREIAGYYINRHDPAAICGF